MGLKETEKLTASFCRILKTFQNVKFVVLLMTPDAADPVKSNINEYIDRYHSHIPRRMPVHL